MGAGLGSDGESGAVLGSDGESGAGLGSGGEGVWGRDSVVVVGESGGGTR